MEQYVGSISHDLHRVKLFEAHFLVVKKQNMKLARRALIIKKTTHDARDAHFDLQQQYILLARSILVVTKKIREARLAQFECENQYMSLARRSLTV